MQEKRLSENVARTLMILGSEIYILQKTLKTKVGIALKKASVTACVSVASVMSDFL